MDSFLVYIYVNRKHPRPPAITVNGPPIETPSVR